MPRKLCATERFARAFLATRASDQGDGKQGSEIKTGTYGIGPATKRPRQVDMKLAPDEISTRRLNSEDENVSDNCENQG